MASENVVSLYAVMEFLLNRVGLAVPRIYRLQFDVPQWECGKLMEWIYANALTLWDVGYRAAETFLGDADAAASSAAAQGAAAPTLPPDKYRYLKTLSPDSRDEDFIRLLGLTLRFVQGGTA